MKIEFTGTLSEVQTKAAEWKSANPRATITGESAPSGWGYAVPGRDLTEEPNWKITIDYEDPA